MKTIRGREAITRSKLENEGWEFVSQTPGTLRTEMLFRRPRPKSVGAHLQQGWLFLRGLPTIVQRVLAAGVAALVLLIVVASVVSGQRSDMHAASDAPSQVATGSTEPPSFGPKSPQSMTSPSPPAVEPTETAVDEPVDEPESEPTGPGEILTVKNNEEFATLLSTTDNCGDTVIKFVAKYEGRTIEFDGSVSAVAPHDNYKTRYDILVNSGDKGVDSTRGPEFQFRDVNVSDLNLGEGTPPAI